MITQTLAASTVAALLACVTSPPGLAALRGEEKVVPVVVKIEGGKWTLEVGPAQVGVASEARSKTRELRLTVEYLSGKEPFELTRADPRLVYVDDPPAKGLVQDRPSGSFIVFVPLRQGIRGFRLKGTSPRLAGLDLKFEIHGTWVIGTISPVP